MKRRSFFKTLGVAIAAGPTIAKAIASAKWTAAPTPAAVGWDTLSASEINEMFAAQAVRMRAAMIRHLRERNPFLELLKKTP